MTNGNNRISILHHAHHISSIQIGSKRIMERYQGDWELFLNYISQHYDELKFKYMAFCKQNNYTWDWDIFQDTIVKCHDAIKRKGSLKDTSPQGIQNYFFIAFKLNIKREGQYARNMKKDMNITSDKINEYYEEWYNANHTSERTKLVSDLWKDFSCLYILRYVEKNFDSEHFYLFRLKSLCGYTYQQLRDKTGIPKSRQKVVEVKTYLKNNLKKEEIREAFHEIYGDLILD